MAQGSDSYRQFVSSFSASHPHLRGPELISQAARAWRAHKGGSNMALRLLSNPVSNPRRKSHKARRRRHNPDTSMYSSETGTTWANPSRKRRHTRHAVHRTHRRNPFGIEKVTEKAWGVSPMEIAGGVAGFVGAEIVGGMIAPMLAGILPAPATAPASGTIDFMYALTRTLPRALAGAALYFVSKELKVGTGFSNAVGIGASSAAAAQFLGASHVAPNLLHDGSLHIGANLSGNPAGATVVVPSRQLVSGDGTSVQAVGGLLNSGSIQAVGVSAN